MGLYFNLSDEERVFATKRSALCLIIYDIASNKRRLKLSKLLEGYGVRVQRSCFEVNLEKSTYHLLLRDIEHFYREEEGDDIIMYVVQKEEVVRFSTREGAKPLEDVIIL